jgi:hypothetical protein
MIGPLLTPQLGVLRLAGEKRVQGNGVILER